MSEKELEFVTFCIGNLSDRLNKSQTEVYNLLNDSGILQDYIVDSYDVLHTFGKDYLMDDLVSLMQEKQVL